MPKNQITFWKACLLILICISSAQKAFSQNGLSFAGHEVVQDKRTGLSLFPTDPYCSDGSFEFSFDLCFASGYENYFGYITRIIDDKGKGIDLIYDNGLKIVVGDKLSSLVFDITPETLSNSWTKVKIKFDVERNKLWLTCNGKAKSENFHYQKERCYKINFGLINYKNFSTTDVPAMKIKEVRISRDKKLLYYWPLKEKDGAVALDQIKRTRSLVVNPHWINKMHYDWQLIKSYKLHGAVSITYNPKDETIFLIGEDSLISSNLKTSKEDVRLYRSGHLYLPDGNQSIYDTISNKLFNFSLDEQAVLEFNWITNVWNKEYAYPAEKTNHGHSNKFVSVVDSNLYVLGGYGNFFYRNDIYRYSFSHQSWALIDSQAVNYTPRYLAALGPVKTGAYILGGYGSMSGKQVLNPRSFYDLLYFDVASKKISKKYELTIEEEDFVFANSLLIDTIRDSYYGLIFPKHKFQSHLQLIKGSLNEPTYTHLGSDIPYTFSDVNSYADLYYSFSTKRFIAVTSYLDPQGITNVQLYSLLNPALSSKTVDHVGRKSFYSLPVLIGLACSILILLYLVIAYLKSKRFRYEVLKNRRVDVVKEGMEKSNLREKDVNIYLFGDFSIINKERADIIIYFTPLLKELFLLILLYTLRWHKGISSEKLIELLWFDKRGDSARNNRSANIAKLKQLLDKYSDIKLMKEGNYWRIVVADNVFIDYAVYLNLTKHGGVNRAATLDLVEISQRGAFLRGIEYGWLDIFKSEVSTNMVSVFLTQMHALSIRDNAEKMIRLANHVFTFDPVNEEAVILKCRALANLGQHSQAAHTFENFCREYEILYGQKFDKDFKTVMVD